MPSWVAKRHKHTSAFLLSSSIIILHIIVIIISPSHLREFAPLFGVTKRYRAKGSLPYTYWQTDRVHAGSQAFVRSPSRADRTAAADPHATAVHHHHFGLAMALLLVRAYKSQHRKAHSNDTLWKSLLTWSDYLSMSVFTLNVGVTES
jgi:hypothetical protein